MTVNHIDIYQDALDKNKSNIIIEMEQETYTISVDNKDLNNNVIDKIERMIYDREKKHPSIFFRK